MTNMLHRDPDDMGPAIEMALDLIGFIVRELPCDFDITVWLAAEKQNDGDRVIFGTASSDEGPIESSDVDRFKQLIEQQRSKTPTKDVLIGNADRGHAPAKRTEWFEEESLEMARKSDICLISSSELFTIAAFLMKKTESDQLDKLQASIHREIIACDSQLELNRKKYPL